MSVLLLHPLISAAGAAHAEHRASVFFLQLALLIVAGRLLGEWMQRMRQPAVMGQLLAGIILGPTIFGAIWPAAQQAIFPASAADRQMLNAVSELGVLMLLLLTGMETDLAVVKRVRRTAAITSAAGIIIPFACGYALGQALPAGLLPDANKRLLTSLFLATALSISSVKIVAAVLRDVDFLRRNLGQVILASAILDDTIGWTILAFIGGLAAHGKIVLGPVLFSILGVAAFLVFCFTIGRRWVARAIRFTNDHFVIEMPVISAILVITLLLALVTDYIGVHTVLGAFVAGIMIGQSPILTQHIEEELRGLIVALFMPVFFGLAGLSIDLKVLSDPVLLGLALLLIGIASVGKLGGCYLGSRIARLNHQEALAVGFAMNARGSTEIILATIGLSMGVLNQRLFTIIVLMAAVTTLCMPPLLRWALERVPMHDDEKARLDSEAAEEHDLLPKVERILVGIDSGENGILASRLAGWLVGARRLMSTVIAMRDSSGIGGSGSGATESLVQAAEGAASAVDKVSQAAAVNAKVEASDPVGTASKGGPEKLPIRDLIAIRTVEQDDGAAESGSARAMLEESRNGYGLVFLGLGTRLGMRPTGFSDGIEKIVREFSGPVAIVLNTQGQAPFDTANLERILVPTTGADYSRFGAEVAVAIAKGSGAAITALHVSAPPTDRDLLRRRSLSARPEKALLAGVVALGQREGVRVTTRVLLNRSKETAIIGQAVLGRHQLIVLGTKAWSGAQLHFGQSAMAIIESAPCPVLIVKS